ncbi:cyclic nucleotide-gated cation channel alpha-3-like [Octopus vulgaris]|uniref:Cyclic nucleotide-gated cation channel alpha-3-like n=3 Tax=Octopus TaxID=6643 RepID=A0AA36ALS1_OCTVU|nr:cyclic nucleotide-gated cation channel alpha-3-like [Octopus vulgaris]
MVRLNRLMRLYRMRQFFDILETRTSFPNLIRIIHIIVYVTLLIHWNACLYYALSAWIGLGKDAWVYPNEVINFDVLPKEHPYLTMRHQYLMPLWWSMQTLTTIGETQPPVTIISYIYVIIAFMFGVLIFASIFGNVGAMINNSNLVKDNFRTRLDGVKRYMQTRQVDFELQTRVLKWFDYTWEKRQIIDENLYVQCLPLNLQTEIAMQVHLETLRKVRIFQDCEPGLLHELVLKLRLQVFSPGDFVCRKGDIGREMYIVKSGKLQVLSEDLSVVFKEFGEGESFGDLSVLTIPGNKYGNRRTATVRSIGFTDLFSLCKTDLLAALETYPEAKNILIERASEILRKEGALDAELADKVARESHEAKLNSTLRGVRKLNMKFDNNTQEQLKMENMIVSKINDMIEVLSEIRRIMLSTPEDAGNVQ